MLKAIVARCHQRIMQGDCPTEAPFPVEQLEEAIAEQDKQLATAEARAQVPREPTDAMSDAGWKAVFAYTNGTNHLLSNGLEAAWCAMYDAALAPDSGKERG